MGENVTAGRGVLGRARGFVKGRPASQKVGGGVAAAGGWGDAGCGGWTGGGACRAEGEDASTSVSTEAASGAEMRIG